MSDDPRRRPPPYAWPTWKTALHTFLRRFLNTVRRGSVALAVLLIKTYQVALSPLLPFNQCRYHPSCSEYALEALEKYGLLKGLTLAVRRILRCHPFSRNGVYDPVP